MPKYLALTRIKYNDKLIEADETFECTDKEAQQLCDVGAAKFLNRTRKKRVPTVEELTEETTGDSPAFL